EVKAHWSTGKVGMIGASYNGTLALAAATTGVDGLEAIIPIAPVTSWYNYYRSNGLVRSPGGYIGEDMDVLFDGIHSGDKQNRASNSKYVRDSILVPGQDRVTGDYNSFWESRNYLLQMDSMKAAMFMVHSFNDWNVMAEHSYNAYRVAKRMGLPVKLYYGLGGHGVPPPFELMNLWFTKYLHGVENDIEKSVEVLIERPGFRSAVGYTAFPDEKAEKVALYFSPIKNSPSILALHNSKTATFESFVDDYHVPAEELILAKSSHNRLLYLSSELNNSLRISGSPSVLLSIKLSASKGNVSVYLVAVKEQPDGKRSYTLLTRGWADPENYKSIAETARLDSNTFYDLKFDLVPTDKIIEANHKIGLLIFSSDKDFTLQPKPGTKFTIDLMNSSFTLPVVGGIESFEQAIK
ncbi:MAG: CocE/NonD family hydrolase, partial [Putridiphycobacter sp.]|nr:CocE/NonD family hydrolase [Putridiphycobacter sp.]